MSKKAIEIVNLWQVQKFNRVFDLLGTGEGAILGDHLTPPSSGCSVSGSPCGHLLLRCLSVCRVTCCGNSCHASTYEAFSNPPKAISGSVVFQGLALRETTTKLPLQVLSTLMDPLLSEECSLKCQIVLGVPESIIPKKRLEWYIEMAIIKPPTRHLQRYGLNEHGHRYYCSCQQREVEMCFRGYPAL